jgi:hypothetical protein
VKLGQPDPFSTEDLALAHKPEVQTGIKRILDLCLAHRFSLYPTLLVPDGAFMIDRRIGVYGLPIRLCYSEIAGEEWRILTGCDPNNSPWSYHNGGSWPVLLWTFVVSSRRINFLIEKIDYLASTDYSCSSGRFIAVFNTSLVIAGIEL